LHTVNAARGIWVLRKLVPLEPAAKDGQFMAHWNAVLGFEGICLEISTKARTYS
jgi:hypothetical protein